jgi:hypothetical protein
MKRIVVNIDRLVLHGFAERDRHEVAQGFQEALTHALAGSGVARRLARLGSVPRLHAGPVRMARAPEAHAFGGTLAHAIVKGLKT